MIQGRQCERTVPHPLLRLPSSFPSLPSLFIFSAPRSSPPVYFCPSHLRREWLWLIKCFQFFLKPQQNKTKPQNNKNPHQTNTANHPLVFRSAAASSSDQTVIYVLLTEPSPFPTFSSQEPEPHRRRQNQGHSDFKVVKTLLLHRLERDVCCCAVLLSAWILSYSFPLAPSNKVNPCSPAHLFFF